MTAPALSGLVAVPWLAKRDPRLRVLAAAGFALVAVGLTLAMTILARAVPIAPALAALVDTLEPVVLGTP